MSTPITFEEVVPTLKKTCHWGGWGGWGGWVPVHVSQDSNSGQRFHFLVTELGGKLRNAVSGADGRAQWPQEAAADFASLGLQCTNYREEARPCS